MRILHTADWHLADRLKHVDRTADIERAVERIADCCDREAVDVLLIAGDIFSELSKPPSFQSSVAHLGRVFRPFLLRGGTIVALTGNHDNDVLCEVLRRAFQLAAPTDARMGDVLPGGRLYLAVRPVHFRLADHRGQQAQFACLPYPTTGRYLAGNAPSDFANFSQRCRLLQSSYIQHLQRIHNRLDSRLPSVLATHINVVPATAQGLFRTGHEDDIVVTHPAVTAGWDYVALGHLHRPQTVRGLARVRYSGSIERLAIHEQDHSKGVVLIDINEPGGLRSVRFVTLPATPFYDLRIDNPQRDLPQLRSRHPDASTALVRCHVVFQPGEDNLHEILAELSRIFPRCYERTWSAARKPSAKSYRLATARRFSPLAPPCPAQSDDIQREEVAESLLEAGDSIQQTVLAYLREQLAQDSDISEILSMAERLLEETN